MKKQGLVIICVLTTAILIHELYIWWQIIRVAEKTYLTNWATLTAFGICFLLLAGLVRYIATRGQHSLLLRLGLFFSFFPLLFNRLILWSYFGFARHGGHGQNDDFANAMLTDQWLNLAVLIAEFAMFFVLNRSWLAAANAGTVQASDDAESAGLRPVSKWTRLLIHTIDIAAVFLVFNLQCWTVVFFWPDYMGLTYTPLLLALKWVFYALLFLYYLLTETITGASVGKMITGTMIIDQAGQQAGFRALLARTFARLLPFDNWSFLFGKRGWHDSLSDTYVIKRK